MTEPKPTTADRPKRRGRPPKEIDIRLVVKNLARRGCRQSEIAEVLGVDHKTVASRFSRECDVGREFGRISLHLAQWRSAMRGNVRMLIWLGKQYLGQSEKVAAEVETVQPYDPIEIYREYPDLMERALRLSADLADAEAAQRAKRNGQ